MMYERKARKEAKLKRKEGEREAEAKLQHGNEGENIVDSQSEPRIRMLERRKLGWMFKI